MEDAVLLNKIDGSWSGPGAEFVFNLRSMALIIAGEILMSDIAGWGIGGTVEGGGKCEYRY